MSKQTNTDIARAVLDRLNSGASMTDVTASLAAYLIEERRMGDQGAIVRDIERQLLQTQNKLYVRVTTAHQLDEAMLGQIKDTFQADTGAKEIIIEQTINPDVIGGVRCETAEQRLDLTVRRQLQRLKGVTA